MTFEAQADVTRPDERPSFGPASVSIRLAILPFRQRLFVFDATDPRQVSEVARRGRASRRDGRLPLPCNRSIIRAGWEKVFARSRMPWAIRCIS